MPLANASISASIAGDLSSSLDLVTALAKLQASRGQVYDSGTGAGQVDRIWSDTRTLAASGTEDLDLVGAALLDPYGVAVVFARVKAILVSAAPGNTNNVIIGANVVNSWATLIGPTGASGGTITVRPGGGFAAWCSDATGWATTAATGDLLHVANSAGGTGVTYDIVILGCSA